MVAGALVNMDDPEVIGKIVGAIFWGIVVLIGMIKCILISRRDTTSTLCVSSLTLILCAYLVSSFIAVLKNIFSGPLVAMVALLLAMLVVACAVAGLTLGIVGLAGYGRGYVRDGQTREYQQGRTQAKWGIALSVLFMVSFSIALVSIVSGRTQRATATRLAQDASGGNYVFEDKNFQLCMPADQWMKLDAKTFMEDSSLMLRRRNPEIYVSVIAEQLGVEMGLTTEKLVDIAKSNLKSVSPQARISANVLDPHNGMLGQRFTVDATIGVIDFAYEYWCYSGNGYSYQVLAWSKQAEKDRLHQAADQVFSSFELIDPDRRYYSSGSNPYGVHDSGIFAYTVNLERTDWCNWENMEETDTLPETGGHHPSDAWFSITPVLLPVPGVSIDFVRQGFLNLYQITDDNITKPVEPVKTAGLDGCTYSLTNGDNRYIEQVLMLSNCAYLVSVWCAEDDADALPQLSKEVFDALSFSGDGIRLDAMDHLPAEQIPKQAKMINHIGLAYYNVGRYPDAREWFNAATRCDPSNASYFGNVLAAYCQMNQYEEGLGFLQAANEDAPKDGQTVKSWEASLLLGAGKVEEAMSVYEKLFASGYRDDEDFETWTDLRTDNGDWEGLDQVFSDYMAKDPSVLLRIHQMDLYWKKGDYQKVVDLTKESEAKYGFSPDIAYWAIDAYQELGLNKDALDVCNELLKRNFSSVDTYLEKAVSEYRLKWHRQSKESLEVALKLNPHNEDVKEWLQLVSAELGEGDNSVLKEAIDPVAVPEGLNALLNLVVPKDFGSDFGAYYERKLVLWDFEKGKRLRRTDVQHIKLLDDAGVSVFSSLEYSFNPLSQNIFVNTLLVKNGQGQIVSRGVVKDYYVADDISDGLVSEDKRLVIPVPGLQPGYSMEIEVTRDYPSPSDDFYFEIHYLVADFPVLHSAVYLTGAAADVSAIGLNGVEMQRLEEGSLWMNKAPSSYRWESRQSPVERFVPGVVLGPKEASWELCANRYIEKIEERLGSAESIQSKAGELIAGCEGNDEKYRAIVDWVRSVFTYKPLEFGRSASMPDCAADTLSYRYGDCKDLAVLLMEMLDVAGIESELALVTSDDVFPEMPTTDQFNHMIVYVKDLHGGFFVDPTDQEADAFLAVPAGLQKRHALVLDRQHPRLEVIPEYKNDSSMCSIQRTVAVDGELAQLTDRIALQGYYASWMRAMLKEEKKINWVKWFQQHVVDFVPDLEVVSVSASNVSEPQKELVIDISYVLRHAISRAQKRLSVRMPSIWVGYYVSAQPVPDRKNPFSLTYPFSMELTMKVNLPEGYELDASVWSESSGESPFLDWESGIKDPLTGRFSCTLKPGEFTATQYADYVVAVDAAVKAAKLDVELVKVPVAESPPPSLTPNTRL